MRLGRGVAAVVVLGVAVASSASSYIWMRDGGFFARPSACDAAGYRLEALTFADAVRADGLLGFVRAWATFDGHHPPLCSAWGGLVAAAVDPRGASPFALWLAVQAWGLAFVAGTYRLARAFGSRAVALGAVGVAASAPFFITQLRPFYPQFPMAAACVWTAALLVRSRRLTRRGSSFAAGVAAGVAVLAKMLAPVDVAGTFVVLAGAGLADRATRRAALAGVGLFLAGAVPLAATYYISGYERVLAYSQWVLGESGQSSFSRGVGFASIERWLYYPRALVDNGLGFALALVVAVAAVSAARALRRRDDVARAPTGRPGGRLEAVALAVGVLVAFVVTTCGQIAGESFYLVSTAAPAGVLVAVRTASAGRFRGLAAALVVVTCLWNHALCARDFVRDAWWPSVGAWGGVAPISRYDGFMFANFALMCGLTPGPAGETWPNARFAAEIDRRAPSSAPRLAFTSWHPYCESQTLLYESRLRGARFDPVLGSWILEAPAAERAARLRLLDFVVVVEPVPARGVFVSVALVEAAAAAAGLEARIAASDVPVPSVRFTLVELLPAGGVRGFVDDAALEAPDVRRREQVFEGGPRLVATARRRGASGEPLVVCFFDAAGTSDADEAIVRLKTDGRLAGRSAQPLRRRPTDVAAPWFATTHAEWTSAASRPVDGAARAFLGVRDVPSNRMRKVDGRAETPVDGP